MNFIYGINKNRVFISVFRDWLHCQKSKKKKIKKNVYYTWLQLRATGSSDLVKKIILLTEETKSDFLLKIAKLSNFCFLKKINCFWKLTSKASERKSPADEADGGKKL
jgi:hypothetical protein